MRSVILFRFLFVFLVLNSVSILSGAASADPLVQDAAWTYHASTKSELQGTGQYEGNFTTLINVTGHGFITSLNVSALVTEKREEIDISVSGSGYYKQEPRRDHYRFTTTSTIDRRTLTYLSRKVKDEVENRESEDNSTIGMPSTEFVSTSLSEGQRVPYYAIDGKIYCSASYGNSLFQGAGLLVIVLTYSGSSARDAWLETNGTADHKFDFEKTTGLLASASSKIFAAGKKGTRLTTYSYVLDSTSLWTVGVSTSKPIPTQTPSFETPTTPPPQGPTAGPGIEYVVPVLVAFGIGAVVVLYIRGRRKEDKTER